MSQTPNVYPVILAGGAGARFWPASRPGQTKPFLSPLGGESLLRRTYQRAAGLAPKANIRVACSPEIAAQVREELPEMGDDGLLVEPVPRDTGPAVGLAALLMQRHDPEAILVVLPADHLVQDEPRLRQAFQRAIKRCHEQGGLVVLGAVPHEAATGYGYIEKGRELGDEFFQVERFTEKPDAPTAKAFLQGGNHLWNCGMLVFRAADMAGEMAASRPVMAEHLGEAVRLRAAGDAEGWAREFAACECLSLDYAVLEPSDHLVVMPLDAGWSDIGNWESLGRCLPADDKGNRGMGDVVALDCSDTLLIGLGVKVGALGLHDLVVVSTGDAVLVCPRERAEEVRRLADRFAARSVADEERGKS